MPPSCSSAALGSIHWCFATTRHVLLSLNATGIYWVHNGPHQHCNKQQQTATIHFRFAIISLHQPSIFKMSIKNEWVIHRSWLWSTHHRSTAKPFWVVPRLTSARAFPLSSSEKLYKTWSFKDQPLQGGWWHLITMMKLTREETFGSSNLCYLCVSVCVCVRAKLHKTVPALSMIGCRPSTRETFRQ